MQIWESEGRFFEGWEELGFCGFLDGIILKKEASLTLQLKRETSKVAPQPIQIKVIN
jgi:hypothetical protein